MASLVKKLDELVEKHEDAELRTLVNLIGDDRERLEEEATKFAKEQEIENTPVVVPVEYENGPENYGVNPDAEVTVMMYVGGKVVANHAFAPEKLDDEGIEAILADVPKLIED